MRPRGIELEESIWVSPLLWRLNLRGQDPQKKGSMAEHEDHQGSTGERAPPSFNEAGSGGLERALRFRNWMITNFEKTVSTYQRAEVTLHRPRSEWE